MCESIDPHPAPGPTTTSVSPSGHHVPAVLHAAATDIEDWQQQALCNQTDPEAFFPEQGGSTAEAKALCARCPVTTECLAYALGRDERFGVWAALSPAERKPLRAERGARRAAEPSAGADARPGGVARESAPPPGPARHIGGTGPVATLPTEPRTPQGRPRPPRNGSTFPERARRSGPHAEQPTGASPAAVSPPPPRPTRGDGAASSRTTARGHGSAPTGTPPTGSQAATRPAAATGRDELLKAVTDVLAHQPDAPDLDPVVVATRACAPGGPRPAVGDWELRVAAVALVISGRATRGQTARALGLPSPSVAHWVARHQQQMPLLERTEEAPRC